MIGRIWRSIRGIKLCSKMATTFKVTSLFRCWQAWHFQWSCERLFFNVHSISKNEKWKKSFSFFTSHCQGVANCDFKHSDGFSIETRNISREKSPKEAYAKNVRNSASLFADSQLRFKRRPEISGLRAVTDNVTSSNWKLRNHFPVPASKNSEKWW